VQTISDRNKGTAASPNSTDRRHEEHHGERPDGGATGVTTELGRHYGEHGHPSTTGAGPSAQDSARTGGIGEQARSAAVSGTEAARDMANRAGEQAGSAMAKVGETAQDLANRAREQAGPAAQAVYDQGARAGQYVTRNVHEYPATTLLIAAAVGYGLAYLVHGGGSRREGRNLYDRRTN
jgi:ElaB/YqjD/DUF883 family membrane-anchored ribosome-binding protein